MYMYTKYPLARRVVGGRRACAVVRHHVRLYRHIAGGACEVHACTCVATPSHCSCDGDSISSRMSSGWRTTTPLGRCGHWNWNRRWRAREGARGSFWSRRPNSKPWGIPKRAAPSDDDEYKYLHIRITTLRRRISIGPQANISRAGALRTARRRLQVGRPGARPTWFRAVLALAAAATMPTTISAAIFRGTSTLLWQW